MKNKLQIISMLLISNIAILSNLQAQIAEQVRICKSDNYKAPVYEGGQEAFLKYLQENITSPLIEDSLKATTSSLTFNIHIDTDGTAGISRFVSGDKYSPIKEQLITVVFNMPKWTPAMSDYEATESILFVEVEYELDRITSAIYNVVKVMTAREIAKPNTTAESEEQPFVNVEIMPRCTGGYIEMMNFIAANLKYPKEAQEKGVQGRVTVRCIVEKDGSVTNAQIMRSIDKLCDAEAVRVVNSLPKWTPGRQNGKRVRVYLIIPIVFKLS